MAELRPAILHKHPLRPLHTVEMVPVGINVSTIVATVGNFPEWAEPLVYLDGRAVPPDRWDSVFPKDNQVIEVCIVPAGGGDSGKNVLRIVGFIALAALTVVTKGATAKLLSSYGAWGTAAAYGAAAAVGIGGTLALNALIPPQNPTYSSPALTGGSGQVSPAMQITGIRNAANPYGPVPVIFGKRRIYPQLAGVPWVENYGQYQFLRMLFMVGKGQYDLSDYKVGDTAISEYDYDLNEWTSTSWTGSSGIPVISWSAGLPANEIACTNARPSPAAWPTWCAGT